MRDRYRRLITQLFFKGDPYENSDPFFKESLAITLTREYDNSVGTEIGTFDIVLAPIGK
jgi:hypothetical protein